jgi:diguanylate cyclase (GGDEF)-like protein
VLPRYLRLVQEKLSPLLQLIVLDASGQAVANSGTTPPSVTLPAPWPQTAATSGVIIDAPRWNETYATTTLTLAVPVLSLSNEIIGALVAIVDLGTVLPSLIYTTTLSSGNVVLLDLAGKPLLGTNNLNATYMPLETEVLQRLREHEGEPITFEGHYQQTVLGLIVSPESLPVIVVVEKARADIYQAWVAFRNLFLTLMAILTLLVALVAWRMGRSIVAPLERLTGAADHIAAGDLTIQLPVARRDELGRLTEVFNQMTDNLRRSRDEFEAASLTLQQQNKLLETLSITDSLTGLYNRKKLDDILADQLARFKRNQRSFAVLLLDIDHFKKLNDTYGHLAGDQVLASVARTFSSSIRNIDFAARYGGEEFVIVLPETALSAAREMAERIRQQVHNGSYQFNDQSIAVTLSIGVADSRSDDETADAVLARADRMLYEAKHAGRNRVRSAT